MAGKGLRLFGHPVHPMLAGFPVALWVVGSLADLLSCLRPEAFWSRVAFGSLLAGSAVAVPTAIAGFWDLACLPAGHRAEKAAGWHMGVMSTAIAAELGSLLLRRGDLGSRIPATSAVLLALAGVILCLAGGWLGGELVFRYGVGVSATETDGDLETDVR